MIFNAKVSALVAGLDDLPDQHEQPLGRTAGGPLTRSNAISASMTLWFASTALRSARICTGRWSCAQTTVMTDRSVGSGPLC